MTYREEISITQQFKQGYVEGLDKLIEFLADSEEELENLRRK